jgi:hypothetical protein
MMRNRDDQERTRLLQFCQGAFVIGANQEHVAH